MASSNNNSKTVTTQQQQQQETPVSRTPVKLPMKSAAQFYGYGDASPSSGSPLSLSRLMSSRRSLSTVRSAFKLDLEKMRQGKTVSFGLPSSEKKTVSFGVPDSASVDYGYGDCAPEPPTKRRKFERRNSKTPQMLMQMKSTLMSFDFSKLDTEDDSSQAKEWDGGLEIAEELVMHLQNRRRQKESS